MTNTTTPTTAETLSFEQLGIDSSTKADWEALGFGPFEAALARGDGFAPGFAGHYKALLVETARAWREAGLDSEEGLRWHQAGFSAPEAAQLKAQGVDVETARAKRVGVYG